MIPWIPAPPGLRPDFPPVQTALAEPSGLLCAGGNLLPETILHAYTQGIFPWYSEGQPILWWSPDPRMVLIPSELKISATLAKTLRQQRFEIRVDTAFAEVIAQCAAPREPGGGTWILPEMQTAYLQLHQLGIAHSVESWHQGKLVGGLYGLALGKVFFGESMFTRVPDASKVAFATLVSKLIADGFQLIDCQQQTRHLASLGARPISRDCFTQQLQELIDFSLPRQSAWQTIPGPSPIHATTA